MSRASVECTMQCFGCLGYAPWGYFKNKRENDIYYIVCFNKFSGIQWVNK